MKYDVVVLTEDRYLPGCDHNWYNLQVMLEDELVVDALENVGLKVARRSWSDDNFDWRQCRSILLRSPWDYFDRFDAFSAWLDEVRQHTLMLNPVDTLMWNMDKHYLLDLQQKHINVVETHIIKRNSEVNLAELMEQHGWSQAIVKPTVSGAARHTYRVSESNLTEVQEQLDTLILQEDFMLQPFQHNIVERGEISLMVMGGEVTHGVKKVAKAGDFRVQDDHGGMVYPYEPNDDEIKFAEAAMAACEPVPLYGRVDMIVDNQGKLAIMELELVEPELFFRFHRPAASQLAKAIRHYLRQQ